MRYLLDELLQQITVRLPDNNDREITPAILRGVLTDIVESFRSASAYLYGINSFSTNITGAFTQPAGLFKEARRTDATELDASIASEAIISYIKQSYEYSVSVTVGGQYGDVISLCILVNGIPYTPFENSMLFQSDTAPAPISVSGIVELEAGDLVTLGVKSNKASSWVTFESASLFLRLIPQRS